VKRLLAAAPHCAIDHVFLVCALSDRSHGVPDLAQHLMSLAKLQPWLHSSSTVSTSTLESIVVEMIRERLFYHIRQEVPYSCSVVVQDCRRFDEDDGRSAVQASASIVVKKAIHKVRFSRVAFCLSYLSLPRFLVHGDWTRRLKHSQNMPRGRGECRSFYL
jgi:hypothetical protein